MGVPFVVATNQDEYRIGWPSMLRSPSPFANPRPVYGPPSYLLVLANPNLSLSKSPATVETPTPKNRRMWRRYCRKREQLKSRGGIDRVDPAVETAGKPQPCDSVKHSRGGGALYRFQHFP